MVKKQIIDVHCHLFNAKYAVMELASASWNHLRDNYPHQKGTTFLKMQRLGIIETLEGGKDKIPNIDKAVYEKLNKSYKKRLTPEEILYYIYAVFYSNIYRKKYAEFLKIDFPRVPFTADYKVFSKMSDLGKQLTDLHLMKSDVLSKPVAKYQGKGDNDRIEKIAYVEKEQKIYINKEKYFDNVSPELWNYQIGGYQVLQKYLKDRKNRTMDDSRHYCRIVTAIAKTIDLQNQIDEIYHNIESDMII